MKALRQATDSFTLILDELKALRESVDLLVAREAAAERQDAGNGVAELLREIYAAADGYGFLCQDLFDRVPDESLMRISEAAVRAIGSASPARLGQLFARIKDRPIGGLVVGRGERTREGRLWTVTSVSTVVTGVVE